MAERQRKWMGHVLGDEVVVRHYAVLRLGEELTDDPPTETMTRAEWERRHVEFDCELDGRPRTPAPGVGMSADPEARIAEAQHTVDALSDEERAALRTRLGWTAAPRTTTTKAGESDASPLAR